MKYQEMIARAYHEYWQRTQCYFIGYNTAKGSRMYGTLNYIPTEYCIEMPISESLMVGMGIGLAVERIPSVVCFERHDFLFGGMDQLVNHMDKLGEMTDYAIICPIIVRAIVGSSSPLDPGVQHKQDYTQALKDVLVHTPVIEVKSQTDMKMVLDTVSNSYSGAVVAVERKDLYETEV